LFVHDKYILKKGRWIKALAILLAFLQVLSCKESKNSDLNIQTKLDPFKDLDFSKLKNGDIVVKKGKGALSFMIVNKLKEKVPLSHCGVVCKNQDSVYIIHSVAKELTGVDGVQSIEFKKFTEDCMKELLYIVRLKKDESVRENVYLTAKNYLSRAVPFDYKIDNNDSLKVSCSELVYWSIFNATGQDLFARVSVENQPVLAFNSLLDSTNFEIIYHY